MRWDLARSSLGDSPKESGSLLGTRREITKKKTGGLVARLPEYAGGTTFAKIWTGKPSVSDGWTARTIKSGRRASAFGRKSGYRRFTRRPGRVNYRKYPDSCVQAVQPPKLGGSAASAARKPGWWWYTCGSPTVYPSKFPQK
ncbi:hypothetical protein B296_00056505 [Ensete ventricosum]|uniref:Uncharacterized protein n=1 Tax=Ensete ventricosum TaxID=4639 RepID=A0A426WXI9_ENSVE|nr:hypothetical protein B296_00056505 [Ensete ventricosum]